jgi:hypothetical protein
MREEEIKKHDEQRWKNRLAVRESLAEWADKYVFQMWMTGTFKPDQAYRDAIKTKRAFQRFIERLSKEYGKDAIEFFMVVERFKHGDFTHIHALLNGLEGLTYNQVREFWESMFGRAQVEGYDPTKGASFYLTKYILKDTCDWDIKIDQKKSMILKITDYKNLSLAPQWERSKSGAVIRKKVSEIGE